MTVGFDPKRLERMFDRLLRPVGADRQLDHPFSPDPHPCSRDVEEVLIRIETPFGGGDLNRLNRQVLLDRPRVAKDVNHRAHQGGVFEDLIAGLILQQTRKARHLVAVFLSDFQDEAAWHPFQVWQQTTAKDADRP